MLTLEATLQAVDEIQKTIETAACGWKNDEAISTIKLQIRNIRWGSSDPYIREKVGIIETYTDILYSPRKAERYRGSDAVKQTILVACGSIQSQAEILEKSLNPGC